MPPGRPRTPARHPRAHPPVRCGRPPVTPATHATGRVAGVSIVLGPHQYGKAETPLVRIVRAKPTAPILHLNVSSALRGDFDAAHLTGDQRNVLPTDTQKNSAYVWARRVVPEPIER